MIGKVARILRTQGISGLVRAVNLRLRILMGIRAKSYRSFENFLRDKRGIEIGGYSSVFAKKGIFPVYPIAAQIDNCNFGSTTVWEGNIEQGQTFQFNHDKPAGQQYIVEATAMGCIHSSTYDFVLSSHVLEHSANPILALSEWIRVLKDQGILVMLLPHKDGTFDHRRPVTTMEHLIADFNAGMTEDDLTHMPEILALHDLERDPEAGGMDKFKLRCSQNFENRCFHHHVFDMALAINLVDYLGLQILSAETIQPMHILIVAKKMMNGEPPSNTAFASEAAHSSIRID